MELYNCYSKFEKQSKEIELEGLEAQELRNLSSNILKKFYDDRLEDEIIVTSALNQIVQELFKRLETAEEFKEKYFDIIRKK